MPAPTWRPDWSTCSSATGTGTRTSGAGPAWQGRHVHAVDADSPRSRPGLRPVRRTAARPRPAWAYRSWSSSPLPIPASSGSPGTPGWWTGGCSRTSIGRHVGLGRRGAPGAAHGRRHRRRRGPDAARAWAARTPPGSATTLKHRRDALPRGRAEVLPAARRRGRGERAPTKPSWSRWMRAGRRHARPHDPRRRGDGGEPLFHRRFNRDDTREVRLYLHGGDDVVQDPRRRRRGAALRVIGGGGDDRVDRFLELRPRQVLRRPRRNEVGGLPAGPAGRPTLRRIAAERLDARTRSAIGAASGASEPWVSSAPEVGLFFGGGVVRYNFGFRKQTLRLDLALRAGYATGAERSAPSRSATSAASTRGSGPRCFCGPRASRWCGSSASATRRRGSTSDEFYRVPQQQYSWSPSRGLSRSARFGSLSDRPDPQVRGHRSRARALPRAAPRRAGYGTVRQVGGAPPRLGHAGRHGSPPVAAHLTAGGRVYPGGLGRRRRRSARCTAERVELSDAADVSLGPTLALRAGGKKVWGDFPFFESAFVGGASTVRGLREHRYAGDAALYGNAELRVRLGRYFFMLPGDFGVFGLADVGRASISTANRPTPGIGRGRRRLVRLPRSRQHLERLPGQRRRSDGALPSRRLRLLTFPAERWGARVDEGRVARMTG